MSAPAAPIIPPRPVRADVAAAAGASKLPEMPPRPINKRMDPSASPSHYPQSPLNEVPFSSSLGRARSTEPSNLNPIPRPPSVNLPSIGQEGDEYAGLQYEENLPASIGGAEVAAQTRNIGEDLHLHAPKPSLSIASAKAQVQAVTRTDAQQAATHGFGKPETPIHEEHETLHQLRSRTSFSRPGSQASFERRKSTSYNDEQGPAELGMRVPINPLLGDVQAPSPGPLGSSPAAGDHRRRHHRTKSGREVFLPPGSYGLHGHGVVPQDKFEKDWYNKHPEQLVSEEGYGHGVYESIGSGRGNFALSSDDLNKIVHNTASRGSGHGNSGTAMSYPDEQIGYLATEQYSSRSQLASPNYLTKFQSNHSQPAIESPLRKTSFPADEASPEEFRKLKGSLSGRSDDVMESENEDTVHIDSPRRRYSKMTGGQGTIPETEEIHPYITHSEDDSLVDEHGYSVPILASDEVAKEIGSEHMQPAVEPKQERRNSLYDQEYRGSGDVTPSSRPASRPGSIHGFSAVSQLLPRLTSHHEESRESLHTPLEDVAEYEPLFPDEDSKMKRMTTAERFKQRPDAIRHRFPSQDIWEDTPSSAMYEATVSTPDLPAQTQPSLGSASTFEHPNLEASRRRGVMDEASKTHVPKEKGFAKSRFGSHLQDDLPTRPGMQPRFPSQDIWEDTPDSQYLVTTVGEGDETKSPTEPTQPVVPPRPAKTSTSQTVPSIPARPAKKVPAVPLVDAMVTEGSTSLAKTTSKEMSPTERKAPAIPDRPKPQVPPRPAKQTSSEMLTKSTSATSIGSTGSTETEKAATSPTLAKTKPQVPARPAQSSKIANLRGNFMSDLNQKLGLGPPKEKEPEPEAEKEVKPLEDARKGRARGPQRRAPAKSPSTAAESAAPKHAAMLSTSTPGFLWHIDPEDGLLNVHSHSGKGEADADAEMGDLANSTITVKHDPLSRSVTTISEDKLQQIDDLTPSVAPASHISETTSQMKAGATEIGDVPSEMAPAGLAAKFAAESVDPAEDQGLLSKNTTASSSAMSGHTLEREVPDPSTDAIPMSQHTTAESAVSGSTLREYADEERNPEPEEEEASMV